MCSRSDYDHLGETILQHDFSEVDPGGNVRCSACYASDANEGPCSGEVSPSDAFLLP